MIRCWQCDVEPLEVHEVTALQDAEPRYLPGRWPPGDHPHAEHPPTPTELLDRADALREQRLRDLA